MEWNSNCDDVGNNFCGKVSYHYIECLDSFRDNLSIDLLFHRVSASILNALGCPELVAKNLNEFEQIAIILGNSSTKLHDMRSKIRDLRLNSPLFDCQHFTNDLELLYEKMWQNYVKRNEPKNIFYSKCFLQSKCTY